MTGCVYLFPLELQPNSLCTDVPLPSEKIEERDVCDSPSSPIFLRGGVRLYTGYSRIFSTMRQISLRKQPSLPAPSRQGRFAWGISPGETSLAARRLCSQANDRGSLRNDDGDG